MPVDTNVSPYFDDYSEDKNFHRVLFKPGVAVQARELTQSQTILQNQIKRVGDYLFTDGAKVTGSKPSVNLDARTIRLFSLDAQGSAIKVSNYLNKYVVGTTTDILGYVEFVYEKDDPTIGDEPSIVISLKKFNTTNNGLFPQKEILKFYTNYSDALNNLTPNATAIVGYDVVKNAVSTTTRYSKSITLKTPTTLIEVGDLLVHPNITKPVYVTRIKSATSIDISAPVGTSITEENIQYTKQGSCPTSIVTQDISYFYKNGFVVRATKQKIVPDKSTAYPSKLVSLIVTEQIITSADDSSILDPAVGSSNYFAPGADRLQINLNLASFDLTTSDKADTTEDHIPLVKFNKGEIEFVAELSNEGVLQQQLAERTYDESGNYVVKPFLITPVVVEESNPDLIFNVSAGKAYVGGYPIVSVGSTELSIPKPTLTSTKTAYNITTSQGNYLRVSDVNYSLPSGEDISQGTVFLELHNVTNPTSANAANTKVGTLVFKNLEYDSSLGGTTQTQFRLFYHYLSLVQEAPATWEAWSAKYNIPVDAGKYIANVLYQNIGGSPNVQLGNYGPSKANCYALYREPKVEEVVYWYQQYINTTNNRDIAKVKEQFALSILSDSSNPDYSRLLSNTKSFFQVSNGSPFSDGLLNVNKIKSIVGVANEFTSHATAASYSSPFFYANVTAQGIDSNGDIIIFDRRPSDALIFPIAKDYIKSVKNIKTNYTRVIKNAIFSGGIYTKKISVPETFALGDGPVFASTARTNFIVLVKSGATANVPLGVFNFEKGSVTISSDSSTATIDTGDATFTGVADIQYVVETDSINPRTKTLYKDLYKVIDIKIADVAYSLQVSDINITGVYKIPNYLTSLKGTWSSATTYDYNQYVIKDGFLYKANVPSSNVAVTYSNAWVKVDSLTERLFVLNNGQKDGWYDHGTVKYIGPTSALPGNVVITYDYFEHNGEGPITAESYPATYYRNIPIYNSVTTAQTYKLRDCLDFRPRRIDGSNYLNFNGAVFPTSAVNTEADVTYYLPRIDKVYLSKDSKNFDNPYNNFYIETGNEATDVELPGDTIDKSKLAIATLWIPPYPKNSSEVLVSYIDNKRFTMEDIGKIEKTTIRLDKSVKVQSVEIANLKSTITNDNGDALLKTGVLVENFTNFGKSDIINPYFTAAIDTRNGLCYPMFAAYNLNLEITSSNNIDIRNGLITAKYVEEVFASQIEGNDVVNPNPGAVNDGRGRAQLSKQNSYNVNLLQAGIALLMNYAIIQGAIAIYSGWTGISAAFGTSAWTGIVKVAETFTNGAVNAVLGIGDKASAAYNWLTSSMGGTTGASAAAYYEAEAMSAIIADTSSIGATVADLFGTTVAGSGTVAGTGAASVSAGAGTTAAVTAEVGFTTGGTVIIPGTSEIVSAYYDTSAIVAASDAAAAAAAAQSAQAALIADQVALTNIIATDAATADFAAAAAAEGLSVAGASASASWASTAVASIPYVAAAVVVIDLVASDVDKRNIGNAWHDATDWAGDNLNPTKW